MVRVQYIYLGGWPHNISALDWYFSRFVF